MSRFLCSRLLYRGGIPNPSRIDLRGFKNLGGLRANKRFGQVSSLFQDRFQRKEIRDDSHFLNTFYYLHWNPQKHKYVTDFKKWPFSSFNVYLSEAKTFLPRKEVLEMFGGKKNFVTDHEMVVKLWQEHFDNLSKAELDPGL